METEVGACPTFFEKWEIKRDFFLRKNLKVKKYRFFSNKNRAKVGDYSQNRPVPAGWKYLEKAAKTLIKQGKLKIF